MIPRFGLALVLIGSPSIAADLAPETTAAWEQYLRAVDTRMNARLDGEKPFLWLDEEPSRAERVRQGDIVVSDLHGPAGKAVPHGQIHDWIGAAFIPGATLEEALSVVGDYDHYKEFYKPTVVDSKSLDAAGLKHRFEMLWLQKVLFVTAAIDAEYASTYFPVDQKRWYSAASSTRIQEIENYGEADQRKLAPGSGCGCLWRLYSIARFAERDGGVYVEIEAVALSRDIPASLRWMVAPVVSRVSKNGVLNSLRQTRDAVYSVSEMSARSRSRPAARVEPGKAGMMQFGFRRSQ